MIVGKGMTVTIGVGNGVSEGAGIVVGSTGRVGLGVGLGHVFGVQGSSAGECSIA